MPRKPDPSLTVKEHFAKLVHELYSLGDGRDGSEAWQLHRARVRGFQECGRLLGLIDLEDVQTIIDAAHLDIFGEARLDRRERIDGIGAKAERGEWDDFDAPAYERYKQKAP